MRKEYAMHDAHIRARTQQQFGKVARAYQVSPTHAHGADLDLLITLAVVQPGERALDIATGAGHTAKRLAQEGAHVLALDLTLGMLHVARETIAAVHCDTCWLLVGDATALPLRDEAVTLVTCRIAPHHFASPAQFLQEVTRVLRLGGRFILVDNLGPEDASLANALDHLERMRDPSHVHSLSRSEWLTLFASVGLDIDTVTEMQRWHDWEEWTQRSGLTTEQRAELEAWFRQQPDLLAYLDAKIQNNRILGFRDDKLVIRSWRH